MPILTISLNIPFDLEATNDFGLPIVFSLCFPYGIDNGIQIADSDLRITLWFDPSCVPSERTVDELKRYFNLAVRSVNVRVQLDGLPGALLGYMQDLEFGDPPTDEQKSLDREYEQLATRVLSSVIKRINRLLAAVRTIKGQHWLREQSLNDKSIRDWCLSFDCRGRIDDGKEFRFAPATVHPIFVTTGTGEKYVKESDWPQIREFVIGEGKTDLVRELLAGAARLAEEKHYRASLTEAVTALEVALSNFARAPKANEAFGSCMAERLSVPALATQVKHFGLSGTVHYLLPTILSEELLPTGIINACQEAVRQRQNVVHSGQRHLDEGIAHNSIVAIGQLCNLLESLTRTEEQ